VRPENESGGEGPSEAPAATAASDADISPAAPRDGRRRRRRRRRKSAIQPQTSTPSPQLQPNAQPKATAKRPEPVYAALDLGTNNCRLLIARPTPDGFRVIDAYSRIVRLGEGLSASGNLSEAAMGRAVEALAVCTEKMKRRGVTRVRAIATQACRMAENGAEFLKRVEARTGLSLEIIDAGDEARLALAGCAPLLDPACKAALVFDIGGGSTELISVRVEVEDTERRRPRIEDWTSLPCGVVTLAERHGGMDVSRDVYQRMVEEVTVLLTPFAERLANRMPKDGEILHLLGTSGTVTTISGVHMGLEKYNRALVDGSWITLQAINEVTGQMLAMDYETRAAHSCIGRDRADLVLAGCAILEAITALWPSERMRVADRGLREGILLSLIEADTRKPRRRRRKRRRGGKTAPAAATETGAAA